MDPYLIPLIAAAALAFGSFAGFVAGREAERRRPVRRRVGFSVYDVKTPSGLFFHGSHRPSAEAFASKYGGTVVETRVGTPQ